VRRIQLRGTGTLPAVLSRSPRSAGILADVLSRIRVLDLNREYLGEATGLALLELPLQPKLEALHLGHNALSPAGVQVLADSAVLSSLRTLEFTGPVEALQLLLHSPRLASLRELSLAGARLGDRLGRLLASSGLLGRLRGLSLAHGQMGPVGLADLLFCPAASSLETLDLSFNALGAEGARLLARAGLRRLTTLNLSRTGMGNDGTRVLAGSDLLARLLALDLSLDQVGNEGGLALAVGEGKALLMKLDLIYNPLGHEAREALTQRFGADVCLFSR
jgi:hypothetical protein